MYTRIAACCFLQVFSHYFVRNIVQNMGGATIGAGRINNPQLSKVEGQEGQFKLQKESQPFLMLHNFTNSSGFLSVHNFSLKGCEF